MERELLTELMRRSQLTSPVRFVNGSLVVKNAPVKTFHED